MRRFFLSRDVDDAIERLGSAPRLMILTGAGTSAEVGLPTWPKLVKDMLSDVLGRRFGEERVEALRDLITGPTGRDNLLAAAEIVVALLDSEDDLASLIRTHLYQGDDPARLVPGELAHAVARLKRVVGDQLLLSTTNYDPLLEHALLAEGFPRRAVRSYVRSRQPDKMARGVDAPVFHLHGSITGAEAKQAVLTEGDYQRMQAGDASWQERWVVECLENRTCLFLGSSMSDPNLLRWLYRHRQGTGHHHYAAFTRDEGLAGESDLQDDYEEVDRARWLRVGVVPLYADHRAEMAQFVHEVAHRRRQGMDYRGVVGRLDAWLEQRVHGGVLSADRGRFTKVQQTLSFHLSQLLQHVREDLVASGVDDDEVWQLTLWSRFNPAPGEVSERAVAVGHSDRILTEPATVEAVSLDAKSWASVQAFRTGMPVTDRPDTYASRWRYVRAIPVVTTPRLLVGAMTVASMTRDSVLDSLPNDVARRLDRVLATAGLALLEAGPD